MEDLKRQRSLNPDRRNPFVRVKAFFYFRQQSMEETILSVGIDIGTSTTQLVFSEIRLQNTASLASVPHIKIMDKQIIHSSAIYETPLLSASEIDGSRIRTIVEHEYAQAGVLPQQVNTGAVIITGEAARKANASQVLSTLSGLAGEFVVATAGPSLEGIIAGKGAQADQYSKEKGVVVANLDIGGGTTNIAVFQGGEVVGTSCMDIGGRLIRFEKGSEVIQYASEKIRILGQTIGLDLTPGRTLYPRELELLSENMVDVLAQCLGLAPKSELCEVMATDKLLSLSAPIDSLSFSGGVAECILLLNSGAAIDSYAYDDIGIFLARAIMASPLTTGVKNLEAGETIRATVVGAGSHTTSISGSTITFAEKALPLQNIPVVKLSTKDEEAPLDEWAGRITDKVQWFTETSENLLPALAFKGPLSPGFDDIQTLASAIIEGMGPVIQQDGPLVVIVKNDLAKVLGQTLRMRFSGSEKSIICIDSVHVEDGDYIDIGRGLAGGKVVPVIVKTLVFGY